MTSGSRGGRAGRGRDVAAVVAIIVVALMGGALLIATPFLLFLALGQGVAVLGLRLGVPWLVFALWCGAAVGLLRRGRPVAALVVALAMFATLGWMKAQLVDAARLARSVSVTSAAK